MSITYNKSACLRIEPLTTHVVVDLMNTKAKIQLENEMKNVYSLATHVQQLNMTSVGLPDYDTVQSIGK